MSSAHNEAVVMGTTEAARTPPRNTSSLAHDPISTPIASAKRPRGSSSRMVLATPEPSSAKLSIESPSPMHTVKPVHREAIEEEIKDIFSPVAHFLHDESEDESIAQPHIAEEDEFNPWTFIYSLPPYDTLQPNAVTLPPSSVNKKSLVLDLDETLVHCSVDAPESPADLTFPVTFHGNHYTVHVKLRPYLQEFLESVSKDFEVIVFTASQKVYADALLDLIDPGTTFTIILFISFLTTLQRGSSSITDSFVRAVSRLRGIF